MLSTQIQPNKPGRRYRPALGRARRALAPRPALRATVARRPEAAEYDRPYHLALTGAGLMQAPFWTQGLNRYSYVFNDPINGTDPSGFIGESDSAFISNINDDAMTPSANWGVSVTVTGSGASAFDSTSLVGETATGAGASLGGALGSIGLAAAGNIADTLLAGNLGGGHAAGKVQNVATVASPSGQSRPMGSGPGSMQANRQNTGGVGPSRSNRIAETPLDIVIQKFGGDFGCLFGECKSLADTTMAAIRLLGPDELRALGALIAKAQVGLPPSADDLSKAGRVIDPSDKGKQYTRAGRALQKHQSGPNARPGSQKFPAVKGPPAAWNEEGQRQLDEIVTDPGSTLQRHPGGGWDIYAPDGRGAGYYPDGSLRGFVER